MRLPMQILLDDLWPVMPRLKVYRRLRHAQVRVGERPAYYAGPEAALPKRAFSGCLI